MKNSILILALIGLVVNYVQSKPLVDSDEVEILTKKQDSLAKIRDDFQSLLQFMKQNGYIMDTRDLKADEFLRAFRKIKHLPKGYDLINTLIQMLTNNHDINSSSCTIISLLAPTMPCPPQSLIG